METPGISNKEMEASISLLHMMQPSEVDTETKGDEAAAPDNRDALHNSLLKVVAKQASDELSLPRIAAVKKLQKRSARLTALSRELTLEELRPHFGRPIAEVAREFGICTTFLKKICRRCGIKRWPHRQIRSLSRTIEMLEQVESVASTPQERAKYTTQIEALKDKQRAVMEDPDANGKLTRMKRKFTVSDSVVVESTDSMSMPLDSECSVHPVTAQEYVFEDSSAESLCALVVAVDSVASASKDEDLKRDASAAQGLSSLGLQISSSASKMATPVLTTPLHAAAANQIALSLKISPSNSKLTLIKSDANAECSSSRDDA